jgi:uncharacterized membrane protein
MVLTTVVLWVHVFGAIGWLGAALVFGMVLGPSLGRLSPQTRTEFVVRVLPRFLRYIETFTLITLIFGTATVVAMLNGNLSLFSLSTDFGLYITVGASLALVAVAISVGVIIPAAHRIIRFSEAMMKTPGPPPPELIAASRRLTVSSMVDLVLMIAVTIFMVAAATL